MEKTINNFGITQVNLNLNDLQNGLSEFEMIFDEGNTIRFSEFIGEEMWDKSIEKQLDKTFQFTDREIQTMLLPLKRHKIMTHCFDDGWLHLELPKSLFKIDFQIEMEERFDS
jgi:hypothetical protein